MLKGLLTIGVLMALLHGASAQEVEHGPRLLCDTKEQVEEVFSSGMEKSAEAIAAVNAKHGDNACIFANVFYVRGDVASRVRFQGSSLAIVQVTVIGVMTPQGPSQVQPAVLFVPFREKEVGA